MTRRMLGVVLAAAMAGGCADAEPTGTEPVIVPVFAHGPSNLRTHMSGAEETPPRDTRAQGQAIFRLSKDGSELRYKVLVANIQNVTQAHLHLGPVGTAGDIVLWLYPAAPPAQLIPGRSQGVLSRGVATAANLVGPLAGQPLSALLEASQAGNVYANVHTSQFPPGEIRGQLD
ncbi:MAG: CHRD domain-containing protein [Gemmatimonadales bacterium]